MSGAIGPIDFLLLEFPGDADTKACADALMDLVERDTVHLFDLLVIRKALDGSYSGIDLRDMTSSGLRGFAPPPSPPEQNRRPVMPGLLRGIARTAVVAGTASAVNGRVQRRQASKFADRDAQIYADRQQAYEQHRAEQQPQYAAQPPPPPPQPDLVTELKQLAELKDQGILTEAEFNAQKAKLLSR
jgi:Short C-terminal domain/Family of unknown function (DUF6325)